MSPRSGHQWRFSKDRAELKSMKMENVICHVRFKGLFAKWKHGAWLTEWQCDIPGWHQSIFMDTAFPACCCLTPLGPGACAEHIMLSPGKKSPSTSGPAYPPWSSKRKKPSTVKHLNGTDQVKLYIGSLALHTKLRIFFPIKVCKSEGYKHFMVIHTAFPANIYVAKLFIFPLFSLYYFSIFF